MKENTKIIIEGVNFSDGIPRTAEFTWQAIDYLLEKYDSMQDAFVHIVALSNGTAGITKKNIEALFYFLAALFVTHQSDITADKIKEIVPYHNIKDFASVILLAVNNGKAEEKPGNPTKPKTGRKPVKQ